MTKLHCPILLLLLSGLFFYKGSFSQNEHPIAFPGAEGFGKHAVGGRGGKTLVVSNLNDAGPGSFREAAQQKSKRIIVFAVAGTIHLESPLQIEGNVTIAGHSAPGDGICIADHPVRLKGDQIILRYLRFRMGDKYQSQKGMVDGSGGDDALSGSKNNQLIIDHCSMSWSTDEVLSVYGGDSTTLQWNMIAEPLNYSYHFETGDKDWENHGYGGIWGEPIFLPTTIFLPIASAETQGSMVPAWVQRKSWLIFRTMLCTTGKTRPSTVENLASTILSTIISSPAHPQNLPLPVISWIPPKQMFCLMVNILLLET